MNQSPHVPFEVKHSCPFCDISHRQHKSYFRTTKDRFKTAGHFFRLRNGTRDALRLKKSRNRSMGYRTPRVYYPFIRLAALNSDVKHPISLVSASSHAAYLDRRGLRCFCLPKYLSSVYIHDYGSTRGFTGIVLYPTGAAA
jgi:hypothetical protein